MSDDRRVSKVHDATAPVARPPLAESDYGGALNYTFFAAANSTINASQFKVQKPAFDGVNATLDARLFGPYGSFTTAAIAGSNVFSDADLLRLDTTWTFSDPETRTTYRAARSTSARLS